MSWVIALFISNSNGLNWKWAWEAGFTGYHLPTVLGSGLFSLLFSRLNPNI
jgi:hypothetical protein